MSSSIFFNAHHSPMGAYATFTLGYKGSKGGIAMEMGKPADHSIFIGIEGDKGDYGLLPFCSDISQLNQNFTSDIGLTNGPVDFFFWPDQSITRKLSVSSDIWSVGNLTFAIYSPVYPIPDPARAPSDELKAALLPAVFVEMTVDNRESDCNRNAIFGFQDTNPHAAVHHISSAGKNSLLKGVGAGRQIAICTSDTDVVSAMGMLIGDILGIKDKENYGNGLGNTGLLIAAVEAGVKRTFHFAVCFYKQGIVSTGIEGTYFYSDYFTSVNDVAMYALQNFGSYREKALVSDRRLDKPALSDERRFMMAMAIRSYYGSTELLKTEDGPLWIVNEGEYRMINTLDLTVDHLFYELANNPWTIRNVLDWYAKRYCYEDNIKFTDDITVDGGVSFTHDMGFANNFAPCGKSAYELTGIDGCFSYMTHEQLVNWILCATVYIEKAKDIEWLSEHIILFKKCLQSMINRDHPEQLKRNGIMKFDSDRVMTGAEITTYDSLDKSLGQARENLYLAVKCWAAYVLLSKIFEKKNMTEEMELATRQSVICASTIVSHVNSKHFIPAIFDGESCSIIIPAIEGLLYVWYSGYGEFVNPDGVYGNLICALREHIDLLLRKGIGLTSDGGWKLSSSSDNTWLSKTYLCQFAAERILGVYDDNREQNADCTHAAWLMDMDNSYYAWSDQMVNGKAAGSRYYPRGVTSILWLIE